MGERLEDVRHLGQYNEATGMLVCNFVFSVYTV